MKTSFRLPLISCIVSLCCTFMGSSAHAQLQNGSFESGVPPWTIADSSNLTFLGTNPLFAHTGNNYMNLGAEMTVGSLSQTFNTVVGTSYSLSFFLAHDVTTAPSNQF